MLIPVLSFKVWHSAFLPLVKKIKQYLTMTQLYEIKITAMIEVQKLLKYLWEVCE